jgi:hypothetical protein
MHVTHQTHDVFIHSITSSSDENSNREERRSRWQAFFHVDRHAQKGVDINLQFHHTFPFKLKLYFFFFFHSSDIVKFQLSEIAYDEWEEFYERYKSSREEVKWHRQ